ncbi:MAG: histidine phosphatase family protein [Aquihabitans sp.]
MEPAEPTVELWLVRHGQTEWSEAGRYAGWADIALTPAGIEQARAARGDLPAGDDVSAWSSDLARCRETARAAGLQPAFDDRLRELDFGTIEGATWDELAPDVQAAIVAFDSFEAPGGESVAQLRTRVVAFLDGLPPGRHVVVTHGGVVRLLLRMAGRDAIVTPAQVEHMAWPQPE